MSVFRGSIAEYPGVVVDNFTNCERGRAFFLSHCHKGEPNYHIVKILIVYQHFKFALNVPIFALLHRSHDWIGITGHFQHLAEKVHEHIMRINFASKPGWCANL